ncbi:MAG: hypothetical protein GXO85_12810 [Chlorobi bacterium]|nr:hypothetical protein [Chlorobiota bacterium]
MKSIIVFFAAILITVNLYASDHGIYLKTHEKISEGISVVQDAVAKKLTENGFAILYNSDVITPDYVREEKSEHCGFKAKLIVFTSDDFTKMITSKGNKYLIAGFLRVGIYEDQNGVNLNIIDPETITRIVFNDLYENDKEDEYNAIVEKAKAFKTSLVKILHEVTFGQQVNILMEPIRDDEDLAESSKDMFMMVGQMTFFNDEDQFPVIYSANKTNDISAQSLSSEFAGNLKDYIPTEDDTEYRWTPNPQSDLKWKVISKINSPDGNAVLLGITRPRTEGVSFNIAGMSREDDANMCPGIDHAAAYPVEVLFIEEDGKVNVYTAREMFRMDMYFWDAGMSAFMDHMSMPGILDDSIQKSLLGKKFEED